MNRRVKSEGPRRRNPGVEVQNVSAHGFWLFVEEAAREYFLPFSEFPWFKQATIDQILAVEIERGHILRWPALDVDLELCQVADPKRYPLVARTKNGATPVRTAEDPTVGRRATRGARRTTE